MEPLRRVFFVSHTFTLAYADPEMLRRNTLLFFPPLLMQSIQTVGISEAPEESSSKVIKMTPVKCSRVTVQNSKKCWTQLSAPQEEKKQ